MYEVVITAATVGGIQNNEAYYTARHSAKHGVLETQPLQREALFSNMEAKALAQVISRTELPVKWRHHRHTCLWSHPGLRVERYLGWPYPSPTLCTQQVVCRADVKANKSRDFRCHFLPVSLPFFCVENLWLSMIFIHWVYFHTCHLPPQQDSFSASFCSLEHKAGFSTKEGEFRTRRCGRTADSEKASLEVHGQKVELWRPMSKTWTSFFQP